MTLTRGMGEPMYGLLLSLVVSWWAICEACSAHLYQRFFQWILRAVLWPPVAQHAGGGVVRSTLLPGRSCRQQAIGGAGGSG